MKNIHRYFSCNLCYASSKETEIVLLFFIILIFVVVCVLWFFFFFFPSPRSCYKQLWKLRLVIFTSYSCNLRVSLSHSSQECRLASSDHLETTGFFPGSISTDGNMFITLTVVPNTITVCLTLKQSREYYIARQDCHCLRSPCFAVAVFNEKETYMTTAAVLMLVAIKSICSMSASSCR